MVQSLVERVFLIQAISATEIRIVAGRAELFQPRNYLSQSRMSDFRSFCISFAQILLKNSEIEGRRKSRIRADSVAYASRCHSKA